MSTSRAAWIAVPLLAIVGLTGCTPPATDPGPTESLVPGVVTSPEPQLTANPIDPDATLLVTATATAPNGATLALNMQVHQSIPFDDVGGQQVPMVLLQDCGASFTEELFAAERWSFTRVNVTAIPPADSSVAWPSDAVLTVRPSAAHASVAARGMLQGSADCTTDKTFAGLGAGALALGIPGDSGSLTAWAAQPFGFEVTGAILSDCTIKTTELGTQYGAGSGWTEQADAAACGVEAAR